jgi:hypothetical protein
MYGSRNIGVGKNRYGCLRCFVAAMRENNDEFSIWSRRRRMRRDPNWRRRALAGSQLADLIHMYEWSKTNGVIEAAIPEEVLAPSRIVRGERMRVAAGQLVGTCR